MIRLFYQKEDQIFFDRKAFVLWARQAGVFDPKINENVKIEWIDQSGLLQVS